jgi:hypothetical protein
MDIYGYILNIVGILVSVFIAYHIFFLSKKVTNRAKFEHIEKIKNTVQEHLLKIRKEGINHEVYLVNIKRYFKDYPKNNERIVGYSHIKAEIKDVCLSGVEFFCSMPEQAYRSSGGEISLDKKDGEEVFLVFPVGIVPYEWIEYVDLEGDEFAYVPLFHIYFKGRIYWKKNWRRFVPYGYPYKKIIYYKESQDYDSKTDPVRMKWVYTEINEK